MFAAARLGKLSIETLLTEATRLEHHYLAQPLRRFVVISEVSLSGRDAVSGARGRGFAISLPAQLPEAFVEARRCMCERASQDLHAPPPEGYRWVRTSIHDRCAIGAAEHGLQQLQLLVGLWNLSLNRRTGIRRSFGGPRNPVNRIGVGPIHTIHQPSGATRTETWWYEPDYYRSFKVRRIGAPLEPMQEFTADARRRLRDHPYGDKLAVWIRLYNSSLDDPNWSASFVKLWQALEAATETVTRSYDVTVRRASFIYRDRPYASALLNHLRHHRNRLVHSSQDVEADEVKLYTPKRYVENMLTFHLYDGPLYSALDDVAELLDLPSSREDLKRKQLLVKRAMRMHVRSPG